jgi:hypothetical protein
MFFRLKKSGERAYVQIVENKRIDGAVRQSVIATLGRADELDASGALASLLASGAKLTDQVLLINALDEDGDGALSASAKRIGGPLLFGKIWERLGIADVLGDLLRDRAFEFAVERAVFVATLISIAPIWRISKRPCGCLIRPSSPKHSNRRHRAGETTGFVQANVAGAFMTSYGMQRDR